MSRKFNAILGLGALAAFGFASSAFAQCPTGPVPPWSSQSALGGTVAIAAGGFDTTACRMDATLTQSLPGINAFVRDNTPATEPRYRAQFIINVDTLTSNSIQTVKVFGATTEATHLDITDVVRLSVAGNAAGTQRLLGVFTVCEGLPGNISTLSIPLTAGENVVEIDWQNGAAGTLDVWVNNSDEANPTDSISCDNEGWAGVDFSTLGLAAPSPGFRATQLNRTIGFDEFDSRRNTFIGN